MYSEEILFRRSPKAPFDRRAYAFLIDFIVVWLISSLVTNIFLEFLVFTLLWWILRVIIVDKNKGQSLGRWTMDLKIVDLRFNRLPSLLTLTKREGTVAIGAFLAMIALKVNFQDFLLMMLFATPLLLDGLTIFTDDQYNQSFHDRISGTMITQTKRGFSLDLRLKKLFKETGKTWEKNRRRYK